MGQRIPIQQHRTIPSLPKELESYRDSLRAPETRPVADFVHWSVFIKYDSLLHGQGHLASTFLDTGCRNCFATYQYGCRARRPVRVLSALIAKGADLQIRLGKKVIPRGYRSLPLQVKSNRLMVGDYVVHRSYVPVGMANLKHRLSEIDSNHTGRSAR